MVVRPKLSVARPALVPPPPPKNAGGYPGEGDGDAYGYVQEGTGSMPSGAPFPRPPSLRPDS
jgi:hypothetical protein